MSKFDEYQSAETAKHVRRSMVANARDGFWNGARPPVGYKVVIAERRGDKDKKVLAVDETEAPIVRKIFSLYLEGDGASGPMGIKKSSPGSTAGTTSTAVSHSTSPMSTWCFGARPTWAPTTSTRVTLAPASAGRARIGSQ